MSDKTLVLNVDYSPIQVVDWQRAVCLIIQGYATLHKPYMKDGEPITIASPSIKIEKPAVIVTKKYVDMSKKSVKLSKRNIFARDNYKCQYTGAKLNECELDIDHIQPISKGGKNSWNNMVACSKRVNGKKGNKTIEEAGLTLIKKPSKPHWSQLLLRRINNSDNTIWRDCLKELGYIKT